jgi:hypothetical protein
VARQARRALVYKSLMFDKEYQALLEEYVVKIMKEEKIFISKDIEDKSKHLLAVGEARRRVTGNKGG